MSEMTPREIVQELDKHIIGQQAAKRAVAIALRNRWRRMQVDDVLVQFLHNLTRSHFRHYYVSQCVRLIYRLSIKSGY